MRRKLITFLLITAMLLCTLCGCGKDTKETSGLTKLTLNEVAHSIFYAPMYVAFENGYFTEAGLDVTLVTGYGADKVMAAVLPGEAEIGFAGCEATIYTYLEGASDKIVNFAQLTQRAGNFLVSREPIENFTWDMLIGQDVLGGRAGGMPEMVFEYILRKNGINPSEVNIDQSIDFGSTAAAFSSGQGSFSVEFEPHATGLEQKGDGYIVASLGVDSGYVPYTSFFTRQSYLDEHSDTVQAFTDALQKGMDYVNSHTAEEIAAVIAPQFAETDLETVTTIVNRYLEQDTWKSDLIFSEDAFLLLQNILEESGELPERVPYEELVTTQYAAKAAE